MVNYTLNISYLLAKKEVKKVSSREARFIIRIYRKQDTLKKSTDHVDLKMMLKIFINSI